MVRVIIQGVVVLVEPRLLCLSWVMQVTEMAVITRGKKVDAVMLKRIVVEVPSNRDCWLEATTKVVNLASSPTFLRPC